MLAQHAVAPAMDGGNGRFIHPLCGQLQGMCPLGPLGGRIGITQTLQERIGLRQHGKVAPGRGSVLRRAPTNDILIRNAPRNHGIQICSRLDGFGTGPEECRGLGQPRPDAVTQFQRGRFGEGHHQDLRRGQRFTERRGLLGRFGPLKKPHVHVGRIRRIKTRGAALAVSQHQPQVQRCDRVGLAGAGTGLDQPAAPQRKMQRLDSPGLLRLHARRPLTLCATGHFGCSAIRHPLPLFIHHGYLLQRIPHGPKPPPS